jgi:hypothetical protein
MGVKVFESTGEEWSACMAAELWCHENGISVGEMQGPAPRGLLRGDYDISKWRNMTANEKKELHGQMTGDWRNGPVKVELFKSSMPAYPAEPTKTE